MAFWMVLSRPFWSRATMFASQRLNFAYCSGLCQGHRQEGHRERGHHDPPGATARGTSSDAPLAQSPEQLKESEGPVEVRREGHGLAAHTNGIDVRGRIHVAPGGLRRRRPILT